MTDLPSKLFSEISASKKYQVLAPEFIRAVIREFLNTHISYEVAEKRIKEKLHQAAGAYLSGINTKRALKEIKAGATVEDLLKKHSSTAERISIIEQLAKDIAPFTQEASTLLDIGCGLFPLYHQKLALKPSITYHAQDVHGEILMIVAEYFNQQGGSHVIHHTDVTELDFSKADLVFLFKIMPLLRHRTHQDTQQSLDRWLMRQLSNHKNIILSVPTKSLSGKICGMSENYQAYVETLSAEVDRKIITTFEYENEKVFVL